MRLIIGEPIFLEDFSDLAPKERLAAMTEELNARIKELEKKLEQL